MTAIGPQLKRQLGVHKSVYTRGGGGGHKSVYTTAGGGGGRNQCTQGGGGGEISVHKGGGVHKSVYTRGGGGGGEISVHKRWCTNQCTQSGFQK